MSFSFALTSGCDQVKDMLGMGGGEDTAQTDAAAVDKTDTSGVAQKTASQDKDKGKNKDKKKEEESKKWEYVPEKKNDPFEVPPPPEIPAGSTVGQQFDLDQLLLVGIIKGSGYDAAYIRLPTGEGKVVRINDPLGKMGGIVTEIGRDHIIVEETYIKPEEDTTFVIKKRMPMVEVENR